LNGDEPELVGMLDKALNSSEEGIRFEAVWAVGEMRVVLLKPVLKGMRGSEPSALVRSEIDRSLGKL